ncbi:hypothetical protein Patl1_34639 [Pistacia atlantica]|uniref:Uncharacterized protein n=1 Tax=Pistacia atlantica TaxID=434234 RepID=A0ACC0ZSL8_9ROSI|nr:hypothetical protein Patl1_34639 [Pistacia atlantica]
MLRSPNYKEKLVSEKPVFSLQQGQIPQHSMEQSQSQITDLQQQPTPLKAEMLGE